MEAATIKVHDLLNAAGIGFQFTLGELIIELLNASRGADPEAALAHVRRLKTYRNQPCAPMPVEVLAALVSQLGGEEEPRYATLILSLWTQPWNALATESAIVMIRGSKK